MVAIFLPRISKSSNAPLNPLLLLISIQVIPLDGFGKTRPKSAFRSAMSTKLRILNWKYPNGAVKGLT